MKEKLLVPVTLVGMGALAYAIVGDAVCTERTPPPVSRPEPDAAVVRSTAPPPAPLEVSPEVDAAVEVPEAEMTFERVSRLGLLRRDAKWIEELMAGDEAWRKVSSDDERPTYEGPTYEDRHSGTRMTFLVDPETQRIRGVQADLKPEALSAGLTALSGWFVGANKPMPIHLEAFDERPTEPITGTFEMEDGRVFHYRAEMHTEGEGPWGPKSFRIQREPFTE